MEIEAQNIRRYRISGPNDEAGVTDLKDFLSSLENPCIIYMETRPTKAQFECMVEDVLSDWSGIYRMKTEAQIENYEMELGRQIGTAIQQHSQFRSRLDIHDFACRKFKTGNFYISLCGYINGHYWEKFVKWVSRQIFVASTRRGLVLSRILRISLSIGSVRV